jgi:hypothetical protein
MEILGVLVMELHQLLVVLVAVRVVLEHLIVHQLQLKDPVEQEEEIFMLMVQAIQ